MSDIRRVESDGNFVEFHPSNLVCQKCGTMIPNVKGNILGVPINVPAHFPEAVKYCADCFLEWTKIKQDLKWDTAQRDHAIHSIPQNLRDACFENFDPNPDNDIWLKVWAWAKKPEGFLILWGKPGNGKSHLAAAAVKQILTNSVANKMYRTVEFIKTRALVEKIRRAQLDDDPDPRPGFYAPRDYSNIANLILDDVGVEKPSEFVLEQLYGVLDNRLERRRPTLITSNLHPNLLAARLGERLASRILSGKALELTGPDRRLKQNFPR